MEVSVLLKNVVKTTGEGPHWDATTGCLYHLDINCGDIHRWDSYTGHDSIRHLEGTVGFAVPRQSGGLLIGHGLTFSHLDWDTQVATVLAEDKQSTAYRINDGKCDSSGRLWAGSMQKTRRPMDEEAQCCGALYSLETDGRLIKRLDGVSLSNGLAWSPDNKQMYYIDSIPRKIYCFDFDVNTGDITNQKVLRDCSDDSMGLPDGMAVDADGKLWVACYGKGRVTRLDPETGVTIQDVSIPDALLTTSCCFGGPDFNDLYVTSKRYGLSEQEFRDQQPLAGSVFKVRVPGIRGLPAQSYMG